MGVCDPFRAGVGLYRLCLVSSNDSKLRSKTDRNANDTKTRTVCQCQCCFELSAAVNYYLQQNQKKGAIKYRFVLDKSAILMGTTKILGKDVSFTLYATPQLDDSGNLVLKTKSVAIGSLNAPPSFVLGYIKNNYDLGKWAKINASKATITLDLNQLTKKQGIKIQGEKFDLKQDDLQFKVAFPLSNTN